MNESTALPNVIEQSRHASPAPAPQALAWHAGKLWMGSRDLRRLYAIDPGTWRVSVELEVPGIPWAAAPLGDEMIFTLGEGADDDRYLRRFTPDKGFAMNERIACPEFTGSYLSFDGADVYLSQWYKHRILKLADDGAILREFEIGEEISGQTFHAGLIYLLRGTEQEGESWRISRFDPRAEKAVIEDLARVTFACRSLAFDGAKFWTNHRAAHETVAFTLLA